MQLRTDLVKHFLAFIHERHRVYLRRFVEGLPRPWTTDERLATYRFTNVYRELDTVTQWIAANWRAPHQDDPQLWFAMAVARLINWPETLALMAYPSPWNVKKAGQFIQLADARREAGAKVFTSAYIINQAVTGGYGMRKAEYLARVVFTDLWERRRDISPRDNDTLAAFHTRLMSAYGMGSFLAAQVVADLKHAEVGPLSVAPDWSTFAAPGPGSRRGLNILLGREPEAPISTEVWRHHLGELRMLVNPRRDTSVLAEPLCAQDLQNCLCEYSKYERGYSRQKFTPST